MKYVFGGIIIATVALIACDKTATGRRQLNLVSDDEMNQMGEEAYQDLLSQSTLSSNQRLTNEVLEVGRRIAAASGANFDWEIALIEDGQVNAFCLPGGKIGVYTGIIPVAQNNAALAAVLGHEVGHAVLKHSAERMSEQMLLQAGLALTNISFADSAYKNIIAAAMGVAAEYGVELPFSRYEESEADSVGLTYMAKAGYDPREAIALWDRMGQLDNGDRPPEILSDHPDPANRAKALSNQLPAALDLYNASEQQPTTAL